MIKIGGLAFLLLLILTTAVYSQDSAGDIPSDSYYFIDGFEIILYGGFIFESLDEYSEEKFTIQSPDGEIIRGFIGYDSEGYFINLRDYIYMLARIIHEDFNPDTDYEQVTIVGNPDIAGIPGYRVYVVQDEVEYPLIVLDMASSPGYALVLVLVHTKKHTEPAVQEALLESLIDSMDILILDAAG
jgi:hypothetical protein